MTGDGQDLSLLATVEDEENLHAPLAAAAQSALASALGTISGTYLEQSPGRGELRIDVDGVQPQVALSGVISVGLTKRAHWISTAKLVGPNRYAGNIWFKEGTVTLIPYQTANVEVDLTTQPYKATATFSGGGAAAATKTFFQKSVNFHAVEFECDTVEGATATTVIDSWAHPNRPPSLPREKLSIETVFSRAGFGVTRSAGDQVIPMALTGPDAVWSNSEMHDAMQTYWSRFANSSQWALWVLFAALHEDGDSLGGIMFDDIGPNHRQGTAIFSDSFIATPPSGDAAPEAWVARMRFWTACHEMGHSFNLAHAWQKTLGRSWLPMKDEPEGRSFMNYPFRVAGGQKTFFQDFAYRFSEQELLFMRHAPERLVQMGGAAWFDDHGFTQAEVNPEPRLSLAVRVNRDPAVFEFLEPCVIELKLANVGDEPVLVRERALRDADRMVIVISREGRTAREWLPYAHYCSRSPKVVLAAGQAVYETVFIGAGRNGWDLSEPGRYCIQALVRIDGEDVVSNSLRILVRPSRSYEEEVLAQDFLTDEVGRVLAFDGSRVLDNANNALKQVVEQLPDRAVARHAQVALGKTMIGAGKILALPETCMPVLTSAHDLGGAIQSNSQVEEGTALLSSALTEDSSGAAETLSHIDYKEYSDDLSQALGKVGELDQAAEVQKIMLSAFANRNVLPRVLEDIRNRQQEFLDAGSEGKKATPTRPKNARAKKARG